VLASLAAVVSAERSSESTKNRLVSLACFDATPLKLMTQQSISHTVIKNVLVVTVM
jgi:hypothetical protein